MEDLSGKVIRGYELRQQVGAGGFGAVYRASQAVIGREVAIKVILPEFANQPDFIRRFETEARLVARLEHPNIIPLYDYWRDPSGAYLVMRWLAGGSLRGLINIRGALPPEEVSRMLDQIAAALTVSHRNSVIHRDLKPENLLVDEDLNVYLADFGIAKDLGQEEVDAPTGMIVGSPAYLSPEQIRAEQVTPQTDVYSMGIVLYELLTGARPFIEKTTSTALLYSQLHEPLPLLSTHRPDLSLALDKVLQRATAKDVVHRYPDMRTLAREFRTAAREGDATGQFIAPAHGKGQVDTVVLTIDEEQSDMLIETQEANIEGELTLIRISVEPENPYKGLRAFQEADADDFFGRDVLIAQLIGRLNESTPNARFLAVVGPSGSGKSSVVKAGLLPALRLGAMPGSASWFIAEMTPGPQPLQEIESALLSVATRPIDGLTGTLTNQFRTSNGLSDLVNYLLPDDPSVELLLVIDQFEELFTQASSDAVTKMVLSQILSAVSAPGSRLRVIVTLRADFYDRPLLFPAFGDLMRQRTEIVLPLSPVELAQAISGPADRVGLMLEPGLIETIVSDVGEQPGALPLLQYALTELYERREDRTLKLSAYQDSGGVLGALARRADELYQELDASHKDAVRQMFLRLVTLGEGAEDTRRRARRTEFIGMPNEFALNDVLKLYSKYRLLTFDVDPETRVPTVEVAHEALIRTWKRLREWLNDSRDAVRIQRQIAAAAAEWQANNCDESFLASGSRLAQFEGLLESKDFTLNRDEASYVQASTALREREIIAERERQRRELALAQQAAESAQQAAKSSEAAAVAQRQSANRLRWLAVILTLGVIVAIGLTLYAIDQRGLAETNADLARVAEQQAKRDAQSARENAATATIAQGQAQSAAATSEANLIRSDALRLAAEANSVYQTSGDPRLVSLLSVSSINRQRTQQGIDMLAQASTLSYPVRDFVRIEDIVLSATYSPDGKYILAGDGEVGRVFETGSGRQIYTLTGHRGAITVVAFSPDSQLIATAGRDLRIILRSVADGKQLRTITYEDPSLFAMVFSPDGKRLYVSGEDRIHVFDVGTGRLISEPTTVPDQRTVNALAISPDGQTLAVGCSGGKLYLWDIKTSQFVGDLKGHSEGVTSIAYSPDGRLMVTGSFDRTVRFWDVATGANVKTLTGHADTVSTVAFSPDGRFVASGSYDRTVRLMEVIWPVGGDLSVILLTILRGHPTAVYTVAFSTDSERLLTGGDLATLNEWYTTDPAMRRQLINQDEIITHLAFSANGKYIISGVRGGQALIRNTEDGTILAQLGRYDTSAIVLSSDNKTIALGHSSGPVEIYDLETGKRLRALDLQGIVELAFSPDGRYLVITINDGTVLIYDMRQEALLTQAQYDAPIDRVIYAPDGKTIALVSEVRTLRIIDALTMRQLFVAPRQPYAITSADFTSDGKFLALGTAQATISILDTATYKTVRSIPLPDQTVGVFDLTYSPDDKQLLVGASNRVAYLFDVESRQPVAQYAGHAEEVSRVAFSRDGKTILTGGFDRTIRLWDTDYNDTLAFLCGRITSDLSNNERRNYGITGTTPTCPGRSAGTTPTPVISPTP